MDCPRSRISTARCVTCSQRAVERRRPAGPALPCTRVTMPTSWLQSQEHSEPDRCCTPTRLFTSLLQEGKIKLPDGGGRMDEGPLHETMADAHCTSLNQGDPVLSVFVFADCHVTHRRVTSSTWEKRVTSLMVRTRPIMFYRQPAQGKTRLWVCLMCCRWKTARNINRQMEDILKHCCIVLWISEVIADKLCKHRSLVPCVFTDCISLMLLSLHCLFILFVAIVSAKMNQFEYITLVCCYTPK